MMVFYNEFHQKRQKNIEIELKSIYASN